MTPELQPVLADAVERLRALELGDDFDPRAAEVLSAAGLHRLTVPVEAGGRGASMADAAEVLVALGAVDGSTALGFAMQVHVVGAMRDGGAFDRAVRDRLYRAIVDDRAWLNNAATEEGGGSPARGAIPGTVARRLDDGAWRLTGEKTWTTWLPNLTHAIVTARVDGREPVEVGRFVVDLGGRGVQRRDAFEALGMRGSASGRLVLEDAPGDVAVAPMPVEDATRDPANAAWFAMAVAATYLGVGEGARTDVARWALARRPGDGSEPVSALPSVRLRLGRMDASLRSARIVVLAAARRWDQARDPSDLPLAKLVATRAAVDATDEALRIAGGPGFLAGRLERALRDARAGLINPPLEDVALGGFAARVLEEADPGMSEPSVARDAELGRLAELDYQAWVDAFAGSPDVTVVRTDDVRYRTSPVRHDYLNGVFGAWFRPEAADARISGVIEAIGADGRPFIWSVWPSDTPADLRTRLLAAGFEDEGTEPLMALDLAGVDLDATPPEALAIEAAVSAADIAAVTTFLFLSADASDPGEVVFARALEQFAAGPAPTLRLFAGRVDGEIVATSGVSTLTSVGGIYAVTTAEAWRGRGFGRALTLAAVRAGAEAGMRTSVLLASDLGHPVYRRIGFQDVGRVAFLRWPGRTHGRS